MHLRTNLLGDLPHIRAFLSEVNPEIEPLLLFGSILGLVMLPQATAKIWRLINPTRNLDRTALERHVTTLLMHGIAGRASAAASHLQRRKEKATP